MTLPLQPPRASQAELARLLGVSRQAINDLIRRQILQLSTDDGLLDVEQARAAVLEHVRPSGKTATAVATAAAPASAAPIAPPPAAPAKSSDDATDANAIPTSYHVARTLREAEEAHMARLKRRELEGELIRVAAVEAVWSQALAAAREHLLQVRARLAPMLAAEADPVRIQQLLEAEHNAALAHLAGATVQPAAAKPDPAAAK